MEDLEKKNCELNEQHLDQVSGGNAGAAPRSGAAGMTVIAQRATQELGKPYGWGKVGPDAYDCSGLVCYCITGTHVRSATAATMMGWQRVSAPVPGDICTNGSHCGIYMGPGTMIHAPAPGQVVQYGAIQSGMIIVRPQ